MKTIKLKYFQNLLFLLPLLALQACMPDSLTKFKQEAPKKDPPPVIKPGVIVGDDGTEIKAAEIVPTTKFYYGADEYTKFQGIYEIDKLITPIKPFSDGTLGDPTLGQTLFISCEVVSSTDGLNKFPSGITFRDGDSKRSGSSCEISGTPTQTATYLNESTNAYEPVSYSIKITYRTAQNTVSSLTNDIKLAVLRPPKNLTFSQTSRLILNLSSVANFANFDLSNKIITDKGSSGNILFKDAPNNTLIISRTNNVQFERTDLLDNAGTYFNTEAIISNIQNVVQVNEAIENTTANCAAQVQTSKLYIKNPGADISPANMITYSISPDLPSTAKLCNYTDTKTVGDACYCRLPGEIVGKFDTITNTTQYKITATNPLPKDVNSKSYFFNLIVSEAPEGFNIAQRQLLRVSNNAEFEYGELISEQILPPFSAETSAKGRVLRKLTYGSGSSAKFYIDVELLRGRFKNESSLDNARYYYAQRTIVLEEPLDYNLAMKVNSTSGFSANQYVTGFIHDANKYQGVISTSDAAPSCSMADIGKFWSATDAGTIAGISSVKKQDKIVCNGVNLIKETPDNFTKGIIRFVDTGSIEEPAQKFLYVSSSYESYNDHRHPAVTAQFEQHQTVYEGLSLGGWNPSMLYYKGVFNAASLASPSSLLTCNAANLNAYFIASSDGNGYLAGDRSQCLYDSDSSSYKWTKKTKSEILDSPENSATCSPESKYFKVSKAIPTSISSINSDTGITALGLPANQCNKDIHGQYHTISGTITASLDGNSSWLPGDLVMCGFDNKWVKVSSTSALKKFLTDAGGSLAVGDVVICDANNEFTWQKIASASSPYQHTYVKEIHSKSQMVKLDNATNNYYGRDLSTSGGSAYIVHTSNTDSKITDSTVVRIKDIKGFFNIEGGQAVPHSENKSQTDSAYTTAAVSYSNPQDFRNIERVYDDNTFYLERGEYSVFSPSTAKGGEVLYSITPSLPTGLSFNSKTGEISGTPSSSSSLREYTINVQNAIGTITYKFRLEVLDYFKLTEVNTNIYTAYMHKTGENQHFRDCKINSRDIITPYKPGGVQDVTPVDISCYFEIGEQDLFMFGSKLAASVGGGVCSYVTYEPVSYWIATPFTTSNATIDHRSRINIETPTTCIPPAAMTDTITSFPSDSTFVIKDNQGTTAQPSTDLCQGDYTKYDGPNCDEGEYDVESYTFIKNPADTTTTGACIGIQVTTTKVKCGGKKANCLRGPIRELLSDSEVEGGFVGKFYNSSNGYSNLLTPWSASNSSATKFIPGLSPANFLKNNSCKVTDYVAQNGRFGKIFTPKPPPSGTHNPGRGVSGSPSWNSTAVSNIAPADADDPYSVDPYIQNPADCATYSDVGKTIQDNTISVNSSDIYICMSDTSLLPTGSVMYKWVGPIKRWDLSKFIGPQSGFWSWSGGGFNSTQPYYTFLCQDSAFEVKAKIRLMIRDWDTEVSPKPVTLTGDDPYTVGVETSYTYWPLREMDKVEPRYHTMDNAFTDQFDTPLNNFDDLDNFSSAAPSCTTNDPLPKLNNFGL